LQQNAENVVLGNGNIGNFSSEDVKDVYRSPANDSPVLRRPVGGMVTGDVPVINFLFTLISRSKARAL